MSGATKLVLEYDGSRFAGWARQPGRRTVQEELERAVAVVLRRDAVPLTVAGRTDAGVHALAQVASYEGQPAPPHQLNALLPDDVSVLVSEAAAPGFSARHDATSRAYRYRVLARRQRSAFERGRALWWPHPLDRDALDACAAALVGTHDFTAFTPTETDHVRFERDVRVAAWREEAAGAHGRDVLAFSIEADAFMRNMIRVLVAPWTTSPRCSTARRAPGRGRRRPRRVSTSSGSGTTAARCSPRRSVLDKCRQATPEQDDAGCHRAGQATTMRGRCASC